MLEMPVKVRLFPANTITGASPEAKRYRAFRCLSCHRRAIGGKLAEASAGKRGNSLPTWSHFYEDPQVRYLIEP